ncbi:MAG: hypothetical protein K6T68_13215, partial [Alicyclobacillus shizuokensis]|nr:hypothetical protein [Alicyclobacillus shizuokensis]
SFLSQQKWMAYLLFPYAVTAPMAGWVFLWSFPADRARKEFLSRWPLLKVFIILAALAISATLVVRLLADILDEPSLWRLLIWLESWPYFIVFVVGSLFLKFTPLALIALRSGTRIIRQQAMTMIVGLLLGLSGWCFFLWAPAAIHVPPLGNVQLGGMIAAIYPLSIGYAILRYQLLDIRVVIRKGLVYSLLTATLTALFLSLSLVTGYLFQAATGQQSFVVMLFPALLVAFLFQPARGRIQTFVDRALFRREYEARQTLTAFSRGLSMLRERAEVIRLVRETVTQALGSEEANVWLPGNGYHASTGPPTESHLMANGPLAQWLARERRPMRPQWSVRPPPPESWQKPPRR